ncbi:helix-turn-helix domain-containing protein [Dolichospermum circinale CS-537/01]|uniref:Helix-turn-helix domain-containing protein n=1 Tax=Dolichospermum circinale CS-537/01 TaxID=3021739 RepID=A0ABT5A430_9CYAN|nr:helix-turn-helix domain-containing protein [Dolichospermum circinale]MDB9486684.1 helix-turn-helix domain-containing protein [Dolichospermum circinale CS-537/01]
MPTPYAIDLRSRVIMVWVAKEGSQRQLAERFKVSLSFIRDLLRRYRETGQIEPKQCGGYEKPIIAVNYIGIRFDSVNLLVWSGNREQGTGNREQGIGNREQGTRKTELIPSNSCMATPRKLSKIK